MGSPLLTIADYEARAREIMPRTLFDVMFGAVGAPDWLTNTRNVEALDSIKLRPRVLVDVSHRDLTTEVLGQKISLPVMLAPGGIHQRVHPEGELASARAAGSLGTIMAVGVASSFSIEEVAEVATGPLWFQLYFLRDRELTAALVSRAADAGYTALVLTVDNTLGGSSREREYTGSYVLEPGRVMKNFEGVDLAKDLTWDSWPEGLETGLSWPHLEWLRSITSLPLVIKGIQTAEDARLCLEHGVDAIIVSNHGGHALEGTEGTIEMLPQIADEVGDQVEVYLDSGVRRGTDVLKSLALGARAVFIGRAMFWGLAVDGELGVRRVLEILRNELDEAMALSGVTDVKNVGRSLVVEPNEGRRSPDVVGQLEGLARLLEQGYLTCQEFESQKAKLLAR